MDDDYKTIDFIFFTVVKITEFKFIYIKGDHNQTNRIQSDLTEKMQPNFVA